MLHIENICSSRDNGHEEGDNDWLGREHFLRPEAIKHFPVKIHVG